MTASNGVIARWILNVPPGPDQDDIVNDIKSSATYMNPNTFVSSKKCNDDNVRVYLCFNDDNIATTKALIEVNFLGFLAFEHARYPDDFSVFE